MQTQLPLALGIQKAASLDNFCWAGNQALYQQLLAFIEGETRQCHLFGTSFSGKTHILQAICKTLSAEKSIYYGSVKKLLSLPPEIIEHFEQYNIIALDDLDLLTDSKVWQTAIFSLFNDHFQKPNTQWISASTPPENSSITGLRDLDSRLALGLSLNLTEELSPSEALEVIEWHIDFRKLGLNKSQHDLLLKHLPRKLSAINFVFEKIEQQPQKITPNQLQQIIDTLEV